MRLLIYNVNDFDRNCTVYVWCQMCSLSHKDHEIAKEGIIKKNEQ